MKTVYSTLFNAALLGLLYLGYGKQVEGVQNLLACLWGTLGAAFLLTLVYRRDSFSEDVAEKMRSSEGGAGMTTRRILGYFTLWITVLVSVWYGAPVTGLGAFSVWLTVFAINSMATEKARSREEVEDSQSDQSRNLSQ